MQDPTPRTTDHVGYLDDVVIHLRDTDAPTVGQVVGLDAWGVTVRIPAGAAVMHPWAAILSIVTGVKAAS